MPSLPTTNVTASHTPDIDTVPGSTSSELASLQKKISHSRMPVETILDDAIRRSGELVQQQTHAAGSADVDLSASQRASISAAPPPYHEEEPAETPTDETLHQLQQRYFHEDKSPTYDDSLILDFAKAAQGERLKPASEQNWAPVAELWRKAQIDRLPYNRKGGDMVASQLYVTPTTIAGLLPLLSQFQTLGTSAEDLKEHAVKNAAIGVTLQGGAVLASPLLQAFSRVMLLPLIEGTRQGSPMRSKEMKTRDMSLIVNDMKTVTQQMKTLKEQMDNARKRIDQMARSEETPDQPFMDSIARMQEQLIRYTGQVDTLNDEYVAKKSTDRLNDVFTTNRTYTGLVGVATSLTAGVVATYTKSAKLGAAIQVGGNLGVLAMNQGLTAPPYALFGKGEAPQYLKGAAASDDALKQDATIDATAASTNILVPAARNKAPDDITMQDITLEDFSKQWQGPLGIAVSQISEVLDFNIKMKEQEMEALSELNPGEWKKWEALNAIPADERSEEQQERLDHINARKKNLQPESDDHAKLVALSQDRQALKQNKTTVQAATQWENLPDDVKKMLHDALGSNGRRGVMRHSVRLGMVRMAQPSDFIPQIVQLLATSMQLWLVAGRAFPMLMQQMYRMLGAHNVEQGKPSPIPDGARYATSVFAAGVGILGVLSASDQIRKKIAQRNELRGRAAAQGEKFGLLQNLAPKSIATGALLFIYAMHVSVTARVVRYRAENAYKGLKKELDTSSKESAALTRELDAMRLEDDSEEEVPSGHAAT